MVALLGERRQRDGSREWFRAKGAKDDEVAWVLTRKRLRARERWGSQLRDDDAASRE